MLGSWLYTPKISRTLREKPRSSPRSRSRGPSRLQTLRRSIFSLVCRLPKATSSQVERVSASFFEGTSGPPRQRLNSSPDAPEALVSLGVQEEAEGNHDASHDIQVQGFRRATSVPSNLRAMYGLDPRQQDSQRHSTSLTDDARPGRGWPMSYDFEAQTPSYDESREPRIFPSPATPTRVHFTRETHVTYETVPSLPQAAPRRPEQLYRPSWRSAANPVSP